jgi:hypothetical protein
MTKGNHSMEPYALSGSSIYLQRKHKRAALGLCMESGCQSQKGNGIRCEVHAQSHVDMAARWRAKRSRRPRRRGSEHVCQQAKERRQRFKAAGLCGRCGIVEPISGFSECPQCQRWRQGKRKGQRQRARERRLQELSNGNKRFNPEACAICGKPPSSSRALSLDHCHNTGIIRGLLCDPCNRGLGLFQDSVSHLNNAIGYLQSAVLGRA